MIIVLRNGTPKAEIDAILRRIEQQGLEPLYMPGSEKVVLGALGDERKLLPLGLEALPCVERVVPILTPYKLVSRELHPEGSVVPIGGGGTSVGGETLTVMAGPCSVESREQILESARIVAASGATILRGGAFKPRTSPYDFQGLREQGLELLAEARAETGLPIITEVVAPHDVGVVSEKVDVLQVGARNCQNFELLKEVGRQPKPIMLKRGISATISEWLNAAEYIVSAGNPNVILCERGIRTFEKATRNTLDLSAVCVLRKESHLPVIVDPSHGTGVRDYVAPMARAAVAAGADGLMIEMHPDPPAARSDGGQSLWPAQFESLMQELAVLAPVMGRTVRRESPPDGA